MKKIILSALLLAPAFTVAEPSSKVAWTAEEVNFVKAGNAVKGMQLAKTCAACHGEKGVSPSPAFPSLAGQMPAYLFKQLQDYADDSRQDPMMSGVAKGLSRQDAADLAAWFGSQTPVFQSPTPMVYEKAAKLVKDGNSERILPPCEVCHGNGGEGQDIDNPALRSQNAAYLSATLKAFKAGNRHNDIYSRMRLIAQSLSDEEIEELGLYYQNIKH